ncbi:hypothetical protein BAUCODRAFT_30020 [Baudoinia panamericana UAMH 10762]|uniref:Uncharacterized protein n=1 Tax=Baudoinia panamericana (strain UAMH 10762) TaxID=717646 RepID=M2LY67_BAUPA|nr:uncharacterized protein BAUCODRAFT_30020 [Baudoinia panamericana UAMH 10762]EMC99647.1 hypothetical protein BAUCODRAFT_30020 [Baudoinia panamericana UAMH 10762]
MIKRDIAVKRNRKEIITADSPSQPSSVCKCPNTQELTEFSRATHPRPGGLHNI